MQTDRLNNPRYVNWVKTSLSLLYLREGITSFSDEKAGAFHKDITDRVRLKNAQAVTAKCSKCTPRSAVKAKTQDKKSSTWRMNCSCNVCNIWLEEILPYHQHLPLPNIAWANSNPELWPSDAWEVAKLFQPFGCETHRKAEDSDCSSLLTMMMNCTFFQKFFQNFALLQQIKEVRNACMHSENQEIDSQTMTKALTLLVALLDEPELKTRQESITAKLKIIQLRDSDLELTLNKELHIRALSNAVTEMDRRATGLISRQDSTDNELKMTKDDIDKLKSTIETLEARMHDIEAQKEKEVEKDGAIIYRRTLSNTSNVCSGFPVNNAGHTLAIDGEVGGQVRRGEILSHLDRIDLKCQPCQGDGKLEEAVGLCISCDVHLCQSCFDNHRRPIAMRNHQLLDKQQMAQRQIQQERVDSCTERCPRHKNEIITYYCTSHSQLICGICLNLNHRKCDEGMLYIPEIAVDLENITGFRQVENQLASVLAKSEKITAGSQNMSTPFKDSFAHSTEIIDNFRKEMIDAVEKMHAAMLSKAANIKSIEEQRVGTVTETFESHVIKELQPYMVRLDTFRKSNQNCNLFMEMMKVKNKLNLFSDCLEEIGMERTIQFLPNTDVLDTLKKTMSFGALSVTDIAEQGEVLIGRGESKDTRVVVKVVHTHDIPVKSVDNQEEDCFLSGSVILPNNKLIAVDCNNNEIIAIDLNKRNVIEKLKVSCRPWDVAKINGNQIAVTLPHGGKIVFITVGEHMAEDRDRELLVGAHCHGIDYRDKKLAVSFLRLEQIKVMDLGGNVLYNLTNKKEGTEKFRCPLFVKFSPDTTKLYVSYFISDDVVCYNLDGSVSAQYKDEALRSPHKIAADRHGNIYICSRDDNNIHQVTADCKKIRILLTETDGIKEPFSISFSEQEKHLFVGSCRCNDIKVYKTILWSD